MQLPKSPPLSASTLLLLLPALATAVTFDCDHVLHKGNSWDFKPLRGPHTVTVVDRDHPPSIHNTTWTIDVCAPLQEVKGIPKEDWCPKGTRICGVEMVHNEFDNVKQVESVIPVAGNYLHDGRHIDPNYKLIQAKKDAEEGGAANGNGLQVELHGGKYGKRAQMAVIDFLCDKKRTGNEGNEKAGDLPEGEEEDDGETERRRLTKRKEEGSDKDKNNDKEKEKEADEVERNSIKFVSYGPSAEDKDMDVLRLQWLTKQVCLDNFEDGSGKSGWGFFTWFILIVFMGTATYLIFGSWLNYSRYGARGWDLLPHGDTIRDIPYLFRDWTRKVIDTIQGGGSRSGYSAV